MNKLERKLKIGIDFHGVINCNPQFFKDFANEAARRGHEVYIITGASEGFIKINLAKLKMKYNHVFSILDFYEEQGKVEFYDDGRFYMDEKLWNGAKAKYCNEHKIDLHIDDCREYGVGFKNMFCYYDGKRNCCVIGDAQVIDFNQGVGKVLDKMEVMCG